MNIESIFPSSQLFSAKFPIAIKDLHLALGVQTRWDMWIWRRIKQYKSWSQDVDFIVTKNGLNDYEDMRCTVNMAKELGMVEKTPQGAAIRKYFLHCETLAIEQMKTENEALRVSAEKPKQLNRGKFALVPVMQENLFGDQEPVRYEMVPKQEANPIDIARGKLHHNAQVQRGILKSNEEARMIVEAALTEIKVHTKSLWEMQN